MAKEKTDLETKPLLAAFVEEPHYKWSGQPQRLKDIEFQGSYTCGHCGAEAPISVGWVAENENYSGFDYACIVICPACTLPTFMNRLGEQIPVPMPGRKLDGLPKNINDFYGEIRRCVQVEAYTAAATSCRTLLMHVAADKAERKSDIQKFGNFQECIAYLDEDIPASKKDVVDLIRTEGNAAVHDFKIFTKDEAFSLLTLIAFLLESVYLEY